MQTNLARSARLSDAPMVGKIALLAGSFRFGIWLVGLSAILAASAVRAEDARMSMLARSHLLGNLEAKGTWKTNVFGERIDYVCLVCGGELEARLEVVAPYDAGRFPTWKDRYLAERRQRCFDLASNDLGRCVSTEPASLRAGALNGFQSETELPTHREIEIVFFNNDGRSPGPELIRTTILIGEASELPKDSVSLFEHHMARLTLWY